MDGTAPAASAAADMCLRKSRLEFMVVPEGLKAREILTVSDYVTKSIVLLDFIEAIDKYPLNSGPRIGPDAQDLQGYVVGAATLPG